MAELDFADLCSLDSDSDSDLYVDKPVKGHEIHLHVLHEFEKESQKDGNWHLDYLQAYENWWDRDKWRKTYSWYGNKEKRMRECIQKTFKGEPLFEPCCDQELLKRLVTTCKLNGLNLKETISTLMSRFVSLEERKRIPCDNVAVFDCETFCGPGHPYHTCYALGFTVFSQEEFSQYCKTRKKMWKADNSPTKPKLFTTDGVVCKEILTKQNRMLDQVQCDRLVNGVFIYCGRDCTNRFINNLVKANVTECFGFNSGSFDNLVLMSNSYPNSLKFHCTVWRNARALKLSLKIVGMNKRDTLTFYDMWEHTAPTVGGRGLLAQENAFGIPSQLRKTEFPHAKVRNWADAWQNMSEACEYLSFDVLGTAWLLGKMHFDRQTSFEKMLVTKEKQHLWKPATPQLEGKTESIRWRQWLSQRNCDSDEYETCEKQDCQCRTKLKLCRFQFSVFSRFTLPSSSFAFVYAHSGVITCNYGSNTLIRRLLKLTSIGAKTEVYKTLHPIQFDLPDVVGDVPFLEHPDWGKKERLLAIGIEPEKVLHVWALKYYCVTKNITLEQYSHSFFDKQWKWVNYACKSVQEELFDENSFFEYTFKHHKQEIRDSVDAGFKILEEFVEECIHLADVLKEKCKMYFQDGKLVVEIGGKKIIIELDANSLYPTVMAMCPMPTGDAGIRHTFSQEEALSWLSERPSLDAPKFPWFNGGKPFPITHYGLYNICATPPVRHREMVASVFPEVEKTTKEIVDVGQTVEKTGQTLQWKYRKIQNEWVDSFSIYSMVEQEWTIDQINCAIRWDSESSIAHTIENLYKERLIYKKSNPPEADARKNIMNSCFGKFGEKDKKWQKTTDEKETIYTRFNTETGIYRTEGFFTNVPQQIGNAVTSGARAIMHMLWDDNLRDTRAEADEKMEYVEYQDTDNAYLTLQMAKKWFAKGAVGTELGQVKCEWEGVGVCAIYPGKKMKYILVNEPNGSWKEVFKCKGVQKNALPWLSVDRLIMFQQLLDGKEQQVTR